jgi:hypothetical protein
MSGIATVVAVGVNVFFMYNFVLFCGSVNQGVHFAFGGRGFPKLCLNKTRCCLLCF